MGHLTQQQILPSNSTQTYQEHTQKSSTEKRIFVPTTSTLEVTIQNPGKKKFSATVNHQKFAIRSPYFDVS